MKVFRRMKNALLAATICSTLLCGGTASADQTGMEAVKEAITNGSPHDSRVFREQIIFFLPDIKADVDFQGVSHVDTELRLQGNLDIVVTDPKGNTVSTTFPFYIDQLKNDMTLYFKSDKKWNKLKAPIASASAVDVLATPTETELKDWISLVKSSEVLKETPTQRTMLLDLDESAMIELMEKISEENKNKEETEENKKIQEQFSKYLNQGIKNTDVWCIWTVDKQDWQTITFSINLSGIIQETAKAALNDTDANFDELTLEMLKNLAYYSELRAYTTYLNPEIKSTIELPKELKKAKSIDNIISDNPEVNK